MKIFCVGRNYAEHARELNNPVPGTPVIFMKPATALLKDGKPFYIPEFSDEIHYEGELVLKVAKNGKHVQHQFATRYYAEVTLGIDFTARDVQSRLKEKGHPWEIAKAFDHSACIGSFLPFPSESHDAPVHFQLKKNGEVVQEGNTADMIFSFDAIVCFLSKHFTLQTGDLIFTGTPAGVGKVEIGDVFEGYIEGNPVMKCEIR